MNDSSSVNQGQDDAAGRVGNSERSARTRGTTPAAGAQGSASRQYSQADAREILRVAGFGRSYGDLGIAAEQCEYGAHFIVIDETGVSPNASFAETPSLLWKPCHELMDGPDTPDARLTPSLPFPFNASQLAMFMLDGPGAFVTIAFGEWLPEPDQGKLDSMHIDANRAREAVRAAFAAYHQAVAVVGEDYLEPETQEAEAHRRYDAAYKIACAKHNVYGSALSREQYWIQLDLAQNEVALLHDQRELVQKTSASARALWRKAMVKELSRLSALQTQSHSHSEAVADAAATDGVVPDKTGPLPLTTNEIANCFAGFREWDVKRWKAELGSPDKWLKACQHCSGVRGKGGYESTWWPVKIAIALVKQDPKAARHLCARFKRTEQLSQWRDELEINISDNSDSQ